jgi:hypothetical protein
MPQMSGSTPCRIIASSSSTWCPDAPGVRAAEPGIRFEADSVVLTMIVVWVRANFGQLVSHTWCARVAVKLARRAKCGVCRVCRKKKLERARVKKNLRDVQHVVVSSFGPTTCVTKVGATCPRAGPTDGIGQNYKLFSQPAVGTVQSALGRALAGKHVVSKLRSPHRCVGGMCAHGGRCRRSRLMCAAAARSGARRG